MTTRPAQKPYARLLTRRRPPSRDLSCSRISRMIRQRQPRHDAWGLQALDQSLRDLGGRPLDCDRSGGSDHRGTQDGGAPVALGLRCAWSGATVSSSLPCSGVTSIWRPTHAPGRSPSPTIGSANSISSVVWTCCRSCSAAAWISPPGGPTRSSGGAAGRPLDHGAHGRERRHEPGPTTIQRGDLSRWVVTGCCAAMPRWPPTSSACSAPSARS